VREKKDYCINVLQSQLVLLERCQNVGVDRSGFMIHLTVQFIMTRVCQLLSIHILKIHTQHHCAIELLIRYNRSLFVVIQLNQFEKDHVSQFTDLIVNLLIQE
jgi:hypothetical protein